MKRVQVHLTKAERQELRRLPKEPEVAFNFWRRIAAEQGLDPATILLEQDYTTTGLPLGHGKHWCWPYPLVCKDSPEKQLKYLKLEETWWTK